LRWQWRRVLWTAAVALTMSIGMSMYAANILHDPAFKLHQFIIRNVYLMVIAALLVYVGAYEQRLSNKLAELAAWPHIITEEPHLRVREILEYATNIMDAPRALI